MLKATLFVRNLPCGLSFLAHTVFSDSWRDTSPFGRIDPWRRFTQPLRALIGITDAFLGVATAYPAWSPRERRVITLEDRVLNCFMRSMNGVRPPNGSRVSVAVTAYISWLSSGHTMKMNSEKPLGPNRVKPLKVAASQADPKQGREL